MEIISKLKREERKRISNMLLKGIKSDCLNLKNKGVIDDTNKCTKLEIRGLMSLEDAGVPRLREIFRDDIDPLIAEYPELLD